MDTLDIPDNFLRLRAFEDEIHAQSLATIRASQDHLWHLALIEKSLDLLNILSQKFEGDGDDQLTVQLLGIRMSNDLFAALRLLMSGYYQSGVMQLRDAFETLLLVDLFSSQPERILEWRTIDEKERKRKFKVFDIRVALDVRDGDTSRRREKRYGLLCELGAHPTYRGIALTRAENGLAIWGPFHRGDLLRATIEDMVWVAIEAAFVMGRNFELKRVDHIAVDLGFYEWVSRWNERFFNVPHQAGAFDEIRALLREASFPTP